MNADAISALIACAASVVLAVAALVVRPWTGTKGVFAFAMGLLAVEACCTAMSAMATDDPTVTRWQRISLLVLAWAPGSWLWFSLMYARGNASEFLRRWRWVLVGMFLVPVALALWGLGHGYAATASSSERGIWVARQSAGSLGLRLVVLVGSVLVLLNLERTFRDAVGTLRWRIKYVVLGLAILFAARLYTSSQILLYRTLHDEFAAINALALTVACLSIGYGFLRPGVFSVDIYPSHAVLRNTITILLAGIYLFVIGLLAMVGDYFGRLEGFHLKALFFLAAMVLLAVLLMSDRIRLRINQFVSRHLRRSRYDYRQVWRTFTEKTAQQVATDGLCRAVVSWVSENLNTLSVTIWLVDESRQRISFGSSTALPETARLELQTGETDLSAFFEDLRRRPEPVNIDETKYPWAAELRRLNPVYFPKVKGASQYCVPMSCGGRLVGLMIVGDRVSGTPFALEDLDLLKCVGDQAASGLLNLRLAEKLVEAKEFEAFQTMSTFFVHDLKNTASTLSLTLQNLPKHFGDPAFRDDALRALGKSVDRMHQLIGQLTVLRQKLEIKLVPTDLNAVVEAALEAVPATTALPLSKTMRSLPKTLLDAEQMQKVIVNLLLNAKDALAGTGGQIRLETGLRQDSVELVVSDNGCGMSPEFVNRLLFRPFQTTKKNGTGIGLFHSKMIVDAHQGRFEVSSEPGRGTTFRVLLPLRTDVHETQTADRR